VQQVARAHVLLANPSSTVRVAANHAECSQDQALDCAAAVVSRNSASRGARQFRVSTPGPRGAPVPSSPAGPTAQPQPRRALPTRPPDVTEEQYAQRLREGRCIRCGSADHHSISCPHNPRNVNKASSYSRRLVSDPVVGAYPPVVSRRKGKGVARPDSAPLPTFRPSTSTTPHQAASPSTPPPSGVKRPAVTPLSVVAPGQHVAKDLRPLRSSLASTPGRRQGARVVWAPTQSLERVQLFSESDLGVPWWTVPGLSHLSEPPAAVPPPVVSAPAPTPSHPMTRRSQSTPAPPKSAETTAPVSPPPSPLPVGAHGAAVASLLPPVGPPVRSPPVPHALLRLSCRLGEFDAVAPVRVLLDPGSSHNLVGSRFAPFLFSSSAPSGFSITRAGGATDVVEGFTATARLLFPPSTSSPSDAQTFVDLVPVIAIPDIGPQDLILGKPWFARWTSQLTVDWQSNLVTLSFPNATFAWRAVQPTVECAASSTSVPPPPNAPDPDPYSREDLDRLILSPAQLQRLVRKPLASMFFCFVTAVPDPVVPPSPTLPDPSPPPITAADPIAVVSAATVTSASPAPPIKDASFPSGVSAQLRHVLSKYSSVFPSSLPAGLPPTRFGLEFRIDTVPGANPPASSPYRLSPPEQLELLRCVLGLQLRHVPHGAHVRVCGDI
jgi:hypothetical protein